MEIVLNKVIEEFREVEGYDGIYASNLGRIGSIRRYGWRILNERKNRKDFFHNFENGPIKTCKLVILAFNPKSLFPKCEIHHIDKDKSNNKLKNLLVVDGTTHRRIHSENQRKATECARKKNTLIKNIEKFKIIHQKLKEKGVGARKIDKILGRIFKVSEHTIHGYRKRLGLFFFKKGKK